MSGGLDEGQHEVPTADTYYVYSSGEVQASIAAVLVDVDLKPAQPPTLEEMQGLNTICNMRDLWPASSLLTKSV